MNCLVTAGPTFEPLDAVRRLTNFSTGRLGCELAVALAAGGHRVTLLLGEMAIWPAPDRGDAAVEVERFSTGADLRARLQCWRGRSPGAVLHAAAVGDFGFGRVFEREQDGGLREVRVGKLATRGNPLLAELIPTPKILAELRGWFPDGFLAGWKYEVDGTQAAALEQAREQLAADRTDVCVLNGPAYGAGFGWVEPGVGPRHLPDRAGLADAFLAALGRCGF